MFEDTFTVSTVATSSSFMTTLTSDMMTAPVAVFLAIGGAVVFATLASRWM